MSRAATSCSPSRITRWPSYVTGMIFCFLFAGCDAPNPPGQPRPAKAIAAEMASGTPNPQAVTILQSTQAAYQSLGSYRGTTAIALRAHYAGDLVVTDSRSFRVIYQRRDRIRLEGRDSNGDPILMVADGHQVYEDWPPQSPRPTLHDLSELPMVLAKYKGVSLGAMDVLPGILLNMSWTG